VISYRVSQHKPPCCQHILISFIHFGKVFHHHDQQNGTEIIKKNTHQIGGRPRDEAATLSLGSSQSSGFLACNARYSQAQSHALPANVGKWHKLKSISFPNTNYTQIKTYGFIACTPPIGCCCERLIFVAVRACTPLLVAAGRGVFLCCACMHTPIGCWCWRLIFVLCVHARPF
jgi:hypothetical protein